VLFVSHDIGAVTHLCRTVYWLDHGTVMQKGSPKEVAESYVERLYEAKQGSSNLTTNSQAIAPRSELTMTQPRDMRLDFVNATSNRNDIEIRPFPRDLVGFGKGGATILFVDLQDADQNSLNVVVGGELVTLLIRSCANVELKHPLVGFLLKNAAGQILFGDNTYLSCYANSPHFVAHQEFDAIFEFRMPVLPVGDYAVTVAIADGSQMDHIQHHWMHDALVLKSLSSSVATGLMGIPMQSIKLVAR